MSENAARNFMRVATLYGSKSSMLADLTPSVLYELAAPPTQVPVRQIVDRKIVFEVIVRWFRPKEPAHDG